MNRREALTRLTQGVGLCALSRYAPLAADPTLSAPVITSLRVDDGPSVIQTPSTQPILPPRLKFTQQSIEFPTRIGEKVREPGSNTVIECVNDYYGYAHDYSISSPENADGTLLMLRNYSTDTSDLSRNQDIIVDAHTLELVRDKGYRLGNYRRWSHTDPDTLYCLVHINRLTAYHPSDDSEELLFDFNAAGYTGFRGYLATFGQGGGLQDWNDRYMPISISNGTDNAKMLVFDLVRKRVHSEIDWRSLLKRDAINVPASVRGSPIPTSGEDASFTMSRNGRYIMVFRGGEGTVDFHSMYEVYDLDFSNRREAGALNNRGDWVTMHTAHATTGVDMDGNQVICGENSPGQGHFIDMATLEITHYPSGCWGHTSVSKGLPGYVASYGYSNAFDNPQFDGTIAMKLSPMRRTSEKPHFQPLDHGLPVFDGAPESEVRQYGYHRSIGIDYLSQPHIALTTRGDKAYFVSNHSGRARGYRIYADEQSAT